MLIAFRTDLGTNPHADGQSIIFANSIAVVESNQEPKLESISRPNCIAFEVSDDSGTDRSWRARVRRE